MWEVWVSCFKSSVCLCVSQEYRPWVLGCVGSLGFLFKSSVCLGISLEYHPWIMGPSGRSTASTLLIPAHLPSHCKECGVHHAHTHSGRQSEPLKI